MTAKRRRDRPATAVPPAGTAPGPGSSRPSAWRSVPAGVLALAALTLLSYLPAVGNGYVWDDDAYLTANNLVVAPDGLRRIWLSLDSPSQYFPLVYTSFRLEYALWGLRPPGYHLVNILLHALNALLVWRLLRRLSLPGAWLAAALFALHPVNVESVAWVTERKNVLSTPFFLAALACWLSFLESAGRERWRRYALCLVLFLLALFAKTTAVTLPAAMLLVVWLKEARIGRGRLWAAAPFALIGLGMGLLTVWWERFHQKTAGSEFAYSLVERVLIASRALWFYLWKLAWPASLSFSYPKWKIDPADPAAYLWLAAILILVLAMWRWRGRLGRGPAAAAVFFAASLAPLLGFFSLYTFRYSFVADHYQYVAAIGPLALFAAVFDRLAGGSPFAAPGPPAPPRPAPLRALAASLLLLAVLGALTWRQTLVYKNEEILWRDTIDKNPDSWLARSNLGRLLAARGDMRGALEQTYQAVRLYPASPEAHVNFGVALQSAGRWDEAIAEYRRALEIEPDYPKAKSNLGAALARSGRRGEAMNLIQESMRGKPSMRVDSYLRQGDFFLSQGRRDLAVQSYRKALEIDPQNIVARSKLEGLPPGGARPGP